MPNRVCAELEEKAPAKRRNVSLKFYDEGKVRGRERERVREREECDESEVE